jgi:hypothetical protein
MNSDTEASLDQRERRLCEVLMKYATCAFEARSNGGQHPRRIDLKLNDHSLVHCIRSSCHSRAYPPTHNRA